MDFGADLITELASHPLLCQHLHLPLQSGDDRVLEAMGRGYSAQDYRRLVARVRAVWPEVSLTTDVMVGFPAEGEEEFAHTQRFVQEIGFSGLHIFAFSPRPYTAAAQLRARVPEAVKQARSKALFQLEQELFRAAAMRFVGTEAQVLFETRDPQSGCCEGLSEHYLRVQVESEVDVRDQLRTVRVEAWEPGRLLGRLV
jgi:threonylcarbamoyladenosine tRNA methylthiotransferase MtaB